MIRFQWGRVPSEYRLGDKIRWLREPNGEVVEPFVVMRTDRFFGLVTDVAWNFGSPRYEDLLAFDVDPHFSPFLCEVCGEVIETVAAVIERGQLTCGRGFAPGEVRSISGQDVPESGVLVPRPDGSYNSHPEWEDPAFTTYCEAK
jgi:hypothetical protein